MQFLHMLIDCGSGLRAAIAFSVIKLKGVNSKFADRAFECVSAVQRFGGVIAHASIVVPFSWITLTQEVLA
jgi:hypothetical protein